MRKAKQARNFRARTRWPSDSGAGKTIMAGFLIKALLLWGDLRRCMVVSPGNLVEQRQDKLNNKFGLPFEILTNDKLALGFPPLSEIKRKVFFDEHLEAAHPHIITKDVFIGSWGDDKVVTCVKIGKSDG
jgi:ERCC4-related helicase